MANDRATTRTAAGVLVDAVRETPVDLYQMRFRRRRIVLLVLVVAAAAVLWWVSARPAGAAELPQAAIAAAGR